MENEKHKGWNECNRNIFCSIEADDVTKDCWDSDTNSFNCEYSMLYTLAHLEFRMKKIEYQLMLFQATC